MDIEIKEVQEIIKNLESGGELSIKEEKYLNSAKLCVQLAAENVALKATSDDRRMFIMNGVQLGYIKVPTVETDPALETIRIAVSPQEPTPATDRIVAVIKADGVEEVSKTLEGAAGICGKSKAWEAQENLLDFAGRGFAFAKQLREGADK